MKNLLIATGILIFALFIGCTLEERMKGNTTVIPPNATNIEYINENWGKFTLEGKLVYFSDSGDSHQYIVVSESAAETSSLPSVNGQPQFECPTCHAKIVITPLGPVHVKD